jgi:DNA-binding SARP family transcriptional activator
MSIARFGREVLTIILRYIPADPYNFMKVTQALQMYAQRRRQQRLIIGQRSARGEMGIGINPSCCFQPTAM